MDEEQLGREEILDAIRDWAEEFGRPPGMKAFVARHSVRPRTFQGMYWARWGDAVREAGFEPIAPPVPTSPDQVLRALALATREFGRYPTQGEMAMRKKADPQFPTEFVVRKRLGSRDEQVSSLAAWCEDNPDFGDVLSMLDVPQDGLVGEVAAEGPSDGLTAGYVYLLSDGRHHKVGMSRKVPAGRWDKIAGAHPTDVDLVHYFRTDDAFGIERYWHQRFEEFRRGGEWFELGPREVAAFKSRTKSM